MVTTNLGGFRHGRIVAVFTATIMFTLGDGSIQLLIAPHLEDGGIAVPAIGPIVAAYSVAALLLRFVAGSTYRPERSGRLAAAGCLASSAAFVVIASSSDPLVLTLAVGVNGAGFGLTSTTVMAAVMDLRREGNAGVTMGLYTGFIGAGYALSGLLGGALADLLGLSRAISWLALMPVIAAVALLLSLSGIAGEARTEPPTPRDRNPLRVFQGSSTLVWLAFFCALHINLLSGVLYTFFPLYGLTIGLTLTGIGALTSLSSGVSSAVRFGSSAVFSRWSYRPSLPWMVGLGSLATAALVVSDAFWMLAASWAAIGLSRAVLRVGSAALAMDGSEGATRGRSSGLYLAGLDIGRIVGPIVGGLGVNAVGYRGTFLLAGFVIPSIFFIAYARILLQERR